ncbi:MAG TPA: ABC transporter ATP-binding protein [Opitutaceae bacterium]|nr:ABC transporter ATP-binding protein [Opitutaceae bacterium]
MSAIIEARSLSRFYGMILGLNNVTFTVNAGITGVVGPNGAGKTTFFRLLTGQIRPSSGTIEVFGEAPWNNPSAQARIAYCPESEDVPRGADPIDWLVGLGMISGLSRRDAKARAEAMLERVRLPRPAWKKALTAHSKGMKQRVKLAQCLLHDPKLIILDEPMNGLDPMGREDFSNVLRELARDGTSIVISSHLLHDLEALCQSFILFRWGRIPRAENQAASPEARKQWPASTTFRCDSPQKLARFFFEKNLLQGFDIEQPDLLHARWRDADAFYQGFHEWLLESEVPIHEVRSTTSLLERAIQSAPV